MLVLVLLGGISTANGQTIYDWQTSAPDGNFSAPSGANRWFDNTSTYYTTEPPSGGILRFNNSTQPGLTNNVTGYSIHALVFGASSSSRTLAGNTLNFTTFGGANPYISNLTSGVSHILTLPLVGDGTVPMEIRPSSGNLTLNGSINNNGASLWVNGGSGRTLAIGGSISGAGSFELRNNDIVILTANNSYAGSTVITNSGNLQFSSDVQLGSGTDVRINGGTLTLSSGTVTTNRNFILGPSSGSATGTISVASNLTINGLVSNDGSGTGDLSKTGTGTLVLQNSSNTYSGLTSISQGTLTVSADACLGNSTNVYISNGATFSITSGTDVTTRNFYLGPSTGTGTSTINVSATSYTLNGLLSNNGSSANSLVKTGSGVLILSGSSKTFGGGSSPTITINGGGIRNMANNMVATSMNLSVSNTAGVFYDLNGLNQTFASLSGGGSTGGNILLGGGTLSVNSQSSTTFSGTISGSGQFSKSGSFTLTLSGNNQSETWVPTISAGTVVFNTATAYPQNQNLRINSNAVFGIGASNAAKFNIGILTINSGGTIDLGIGTNAFDVEFANSGPTFSGTLTIRNWTYFGNKRILFTNTTHIATVLANITFEGYGPGAVFKGATNEIIPASLYFTLSPGAPASGNFSDPSIWQGGVVPPANSNIVVMPNFTLNFDPASYSLRSIDVASGGVFSCTANNTLLLGSVGAGISKFSNNGTALFSNGTIEVSTSAANFDGANAISVFNLTLNGILDARRSPTVNNILLLNSAGSIQTSTIIYGASSTLQYNKNGNWLMAREWNTHTTPANVIIGGNTNINFNSSQGELGNTTCTGNLLIEAGSTLDLFYKRGAFTVGGDITISGTLKLTSNVYGGMMHMYLSGNWIRTATASAVDFQNRVVYLQGSRNTFITGPAGQTEPFPVIHMIKDPGRTVTLNNPVTVTAELRLERGYIISSTSNVLIIPNWSNLYTHFGSFSSFVSGPMKKIGYACCNAANSFTFPVGKIVGTEYHYRPLTISAPGSNTQEYTAEFQRSNPHLQGPISAAARTKGLQEISFCEYWDLTRSAGAASVTVTIGWSTNASGMSQCNAQTYVNQAYASSLVVVPYYNGQWGDFQTGADVGDELFGYDAHSNPASSLWLGTVRWNGQIDSYEKFVLGTTDVKMNPLPEYQLQLSGVLKQNEVLLQWNMRSNELYQYYTIQYGTDGIQFRDVKEVPAYSTTGLTDYQYLHSEPSTGWKYYRIVAVNQEGQRFVSNIIRLWTGNSAGSPVVFPNPVSNNRIHLYTTGLDKGRYLTQLTGMDGRVWMQHMHLFAGNGQVETIGLDPSIPAGIYWLTLSREGMEPVRIKIVK